MVMTEATDPTASSRKNERLRRGNLPLKEAGELLKNDPGRLSACAA